MRNPRARVGVTVVLAVGTWLCGPPVARAQRYRVPDFRNTAYLGVGYVASIPEAFAGAAVLALTPKILGGAGLYADVKFTTTTPAKTTEYAPDITVNQAVNVYGDQYFREKSVWTVVDVALVYSLTPELAAYAGAGYARESHYQQYFDPSQTRGFLGFYWVSDPAASGTRVNVLGGLLLRASKYFAFQAGVGAKPAGADAGVTVMLPL